MLNVLRKLHAWAGLALCLVLAALAFSGAALVFKPQLRGVFDPAQRAAPPPLDAAALAGVMTAADAEFGPGQVRSVIFANAEQPLHEATLKDGGGAWLDGAAAVRGAWKQNGRVFDLVFDLHHHLFAGETGTLVTGWIGVAALLMAVSGLVLWWPARRSFSAQLIPTRPGRAGWLAAHRDLAVIAAPMVVLSLLTGAPVALQALSREILNAPAPKAAKATTSGPVNWDAALANAQARFPTAAIRIASAPAKAGAPVVIRLKQTAEWHANGRTIVYAEPATGTVIKVADALAESGGGRLYNGLWPVHAAKVGGWPWKAMILLSGLSLGALSLYGGEAYRRRLFAPRRAGK